MGKIEEVGCVWRLAPPFRGDFIYKMKILKFDLENVCERSRNIKK